jgi:hypothetical protein
MRYGGEMEIPDVYSEKERKDIEETMREFEHQFAMVEEFGEDALKVWKRINEERGYKKGEYLKEKYGIEGKDLEAVKKLIEVYIGDESERTSAPEIRLEDDRLIITSTGFCPLIESAKILDINMAYTCPYSTRPYFLAMCRAVNPNVKHKNTRWRAKGDEVCQEIFWMEE